jgi:hypothetical protein
MIVIQKVSVCFVMELDYLKKGTLKLDLLELLHYRSNPHDSQELFTNLFAK